MARIFEDFEASVGRNGSEKRIAAIEKPIDMDRARKDDEAGKCNGGGDGRRSAETRDEAESPRESADDGPDER